MVAIVAFFVNGISIYTQSCVFSTKYYAEPQRAFEKEYTPSAVTEPIEIKNDIYLYDIDEKATIRKSHENPVVTKIYEEYLGEIGGNRAHELLHTKYVKRKKYD